MPDNGCVINRETQMTTYTLTKIKTFSGRDGHGLNATICRDGKPICFVLDEGCGGEMRHDFKNPLQNAASFHATTHEMATQEEKALGVYCLAFLSSEEIAVEYKSAQKMKDSYAPQIRVEMYVARNAVELWINTTVDSYQNDKRFNRLSKTKTLFRLKDDAKNDWRTVAGSYSPQIGKYLADKYSNQLETIWGVQV